mgnify:CR=1 FL=1
MSTRDTTPEPGESPHGDCQAPAWARVLGEQVAALTAELQNVRSEIAAARSEAAELLAPRQPESAGSADVDTVAEPTPTDRYDLACAIVAHEQVAAKSYLMQRLNCSYAEATDLIARLEAAGAVSPAADARSRAVYLRPEDYPYPSFSVGELADAAIEFAGDADEELYQSARSLVIQTGHASTSFLQRTLRIGYSRSARIMDLLIERGVIGRVDENGPFEVFLDPEDDE